MSKWLDMYKQNIKDSENEIIRIKKFFSFVKEDFFMIDRIQLPGFWNKFFGKKSIIKLEPTIRCYDDISNIKVYIYFDFGDYSGDYMTFDIPKNISEDDFEINFKDKILKMYYLYKDYLK